MSERESMGDDSAGAPNAASATPDVLEREILRLLRERGPDKTICPSEVARSLEGADEKRWRLLMRPVRAAATRLVAAGTVELRRKGRRVEPNALRGIYRIKLAPAGTGEGENDQ